MCAVQIDVIGLRELDLVLASKKRRIQSKAIEGLAKAGLFMQGEVKSSIAGRRNEPTSVDTGRFLNSVSLLTTKEFSKIFSDLEYAKFLEYGTSRIGARRHFNNSKDRNKQKVVNILKNEIKSI